MNLPEDFCVFILTHGRPDNVVTFKTLRKDGYTGPIYIVIDNEDKKAAEYKKEFGEENVIVFDKAATAKRFDEFDNFEDRRAIVYARNECFRIAEELGYKYFLELDDDYTKFGYRVFGLGLPVNNPKSCWLPIRNLDGIFAATIELFKSVDAKSIAYSQGGDWMDGTGEGFSRRKCMNTFFLSTDRKFDFIGRINEDVNTYTSFQSRGNLFLTLEFVQFCQKATQKNSGGMSDIYLAQGTFVKSFYSVICAPSCVSIKIMGSSYRRMHHSVNWQTAVPMILEEKWKKF